MRYVHQLQNGSLSYCVASATTGASSRISCLNIRTFWMYNRFGRCHSDLTVRPSAVLSCQSMLHTVALFVARAASVLFAYCLLHLGMMC
jgi:hypothetical protein